METVSHMYKCGSYTGSTLGYNDFNNLVMQTLWWLPNKILRHIHKKRFSVFLSRFLRICNQSVQKVLIRANIFILFKNSMWVSKNAEFHADFESVEKVLKKWTPKKLLAKTWRKYALFSLLIMFVKLVLLVTFFWCIFLRFLISFFKKKKKKKICAVTLALFANFEAKCAKNGAKNQKTYFVNVS